ncbi:MAG TPA: ATP-binding protein [Candidatus Krumholzibacteria bacterium]|nr:ATP-binding protein [Candidatus Krumholzibacteria bacterium]HPD72961.1 ATP-binding protein [Candidatus Krumholzibacteria bacterium]HRY41760.1 ATP-binding protein [Candidatus Krumholzibacteria bacterium]
MDPLRNPFSPGAGAPPPELAGRDEILEAARIALHRVRARRSEKSQMLLGLRGVGKTVLLNKIGEMAEEIGYFVVVLEAPEGQRLAEYLAPALKSALLSLSRVEKAKESVTRAVGALRGFASAFKVSIGEFSIVVGEPSLADSGNLEVDLPALFVTVGQAAKAADSSVAILVDEVQYLGEADLRALIVAFHAIAQRGLPVLMFGAGLPQVAALSGEAKSYAERLFEFPSVGPLGTAAARQAIDQPVRSEGAEISADALDRIVSVTKGYPYFLQEWGKHTWNAAAQSPITAGDVAKASQAATDALDRSFFRVRFDRLTPREQDYLRAMAELGAGPHRSGAIADALGRAVESTGPLRSALIRKGMVWGPAHGETAFTVPLFDEFMRRAIPDWQPPRDRSRG